jgi:hypothetical protein
LFFQLPAAAAKLCTFEAVFETLEVIKTIFNHQKSQFTFTFFLLVMNLTAPIVNCEIALTLMLIFSGDHVFDGLLRCK